MNLTELGVPAILVVLVLREVFAFLSKRRNGCDLPKLARQVHEIHRVLNREDDRGVRMVYGGKLELAIEKLADNVRNQTKAFEKFTAAIEARPCLHRLRDEEARRVVAD